MKRLEIVKEDLAAMARLASGRPEIKRARTLSRRLMSKVEYNRRVKALFHLYPYQWRRSGQFLSVSINPGWLSIVERMCAEVDAILSRTGKRYFRWTQIGEKFACLRADWIGDVSEKTTDAICDVVAEARAESTSACQFCGSPGTREWHRGWLHTVCKKHSPKKIGDAVRFLGLSDGPRQARRDDEK